ncbi:MAG: hypothetical protein O2968_05360 [Acidobacteria bacterium]|nr:hypothetical protein [Acidobacteriota bacterium]
MILKPREYRLRIEAFTHENIPMSRLAEYMQQFAALLGHRASVHFSRLEPGSAVIVSEVEPQDDPKVRERVRKTRKHIGPKDAQDAVVIIDEMLRNDNSVGNVIEPDGATVIEFPGRLKKQFEMIGPISEHGTLDGVPIAIGGQNDPVPVHLEDLDGTVHICEARRDVARRLRKHLFDDPVRAIGIGRWIRGTNGIWMMKMFRINDFAELREGKLSEVIGRLRATHKKSDWAAIDDPLAELETIRNG